MQSTMVDVPTADGVADAYLARPDGDGPHPAVLFYMDAIGLRPRIYEMVDRIAARRYVVLAPNLFYRAGRAPLIDNLDELLKSGDRAKLFGAIMPFAQSFNPEAAMRDAGSYLDFLTARSGVADGPVALTGYCLGGAMAVRTAGTYPDRIAAAGSFHGGNIASDAADSPHLLATNIRAELYLGHADQDQSMPAEQIARLEAALDEAGVTYRSEVYEGATHGYTMTDTAAYDETAEQRHWTELFALLDRRLPVAA